MSDLKLISKKHIIINNINSLRDKIKVLIDDLNGNIDSENSLINILEKKFIKFNPVITDKINDIKLYLGANKDSISDFYDGAKIIFKQLQVIFNTLKGNLNNNNSQHNPKEIYINQNNHINNNIKNNLCNNFDEFNINNNNELDLKKKSKTPIKSITQNNSNNYKMLQKDIKILHDKILNKNKEIKYLKSKLKLSEDNYNQILEDYNKLASQNIEYENKIEELRKNYQNLQIKYNQLEQNCYDFKSEDRKNSQVEEEFNLKMIAKGAREKNLSQDMNIDNPGLQTIKEKMEKLKYKYKTLIELVKNLLACVKLDELNKNIVNDIYKIIFCK